MIGPQTMTSQPPVHDLDEPLPARANPWQLLTAVNSSAPRWPGALRAALSIFLPGAVALSLGFATEMFLIAAGSCAVIYGEGHPYRSRARIIALAGVFIAGGATAGAFIGSVVWGQIDAGGSQWWLLLSALFASTIAAAGVFVQNALRLRPPGSFFVIMVAGGSTMVARLGLNPFEVGLWALVGISSGFVLGMLPALLDPHAPERRAVVTLDKAVADFEVADNPTLAQRHRCSTALAAAWEALGDARIVHSGRIVQPTLDFLVHRTQEAQLRLVRRTAELGLRLGDTESITDTPTMVDPSRAAIPHTRPSNTYRIYRSMNLNSHAAVTAQKVFLACISAAVVGIALGFDRPDWAIVSAMLMLQWGPDRIAGQIRGVHRLVGSLLGIGLFAVFHLLQFHGWQLLIALAICQFFAEIFVVRNYAFCVIATTPLALLMGNAVTDPLAEVVSSRIVEVLLSVIFASLALWLWRPGAVGREHERLVHRAFSQMGALLGGLATGTPEESVNTRRDLQYELLSERRAIASLAEADRAEARQRWARHLQVQRTGYHLIDFCNANNDREVSIAEVAELANYVRSAKKR